MSRLHITPGQQIGLELAGLDEVTNHIDVVRDYLDRERPSDEHTIRQMAENGDLLALEGLAPEQIDKIIELGGVLMSLARVQTINTFHARGMLRLRG